MILNQLNPFIRYGAIHLHYKGNKQCSICYDCRLFYVKSGEGAFVANGQKTPFVENFVFYLPPQTHYRFIFNKKVPIKIYVINFDLNNDFCSKSNCLGTALETTFDKSKVLEYPLPTELSNIIVEQDGCAIGNSVFDAVETFQSKDLYYSQKSSALLKVALLELLEEKNKSGVDYKIARTVIDFIRKNYHQVGLTNLVIAKNFNYHPFHLGRLFKTYTKKSIHEYLLDYRIEMAKIMLVSTLDSITIIAEKTGFNSYSYFIELFKNRVGISPLKYRKSNAL